MHWINRYYCSVWNWTSTKIEVSNSLLHAKFEGNKLPVGFYVTDTHDFNKTDKVTFQQSYIKIFINLLQFSTPPRGFLSCTGDKNVWQPRIILIMKQQHKEKLTSTERCVCRHMHEKILLHAALPKRTPLCPTALSAAPLDCSNLAQMSIHRTAQGIWWLNGKGKK